MKAFTHNFYSKLSENLSKNFIYLSPVIIQKTFLEIQNKLSGLSFEGGFLDNEWIEKIK